MVGTRSHYRMKMAGMLIFLWIGLFSVREASGQGMNRQEWQSRFEESFRKEIEQEKIPAFVRQRMAQTLTLMEQEGWNRGMDPARVAREAAALARNFDEDLRRGVSPVQAGLLYRQMSRHVMKETEKEGGKGDRSAAIERLRERVKNRSLGKDKMRLWKSSEKSRIPHMPEEGPSDGSGGTGLGGGSGGSSGSGTGGQQDGK